MCIYHMYDTLCDPTHVQRFADMGRWEFCPYASRQHGFPTACERDNPLGSQIPTICPNQTCLALACDKHGWRCHRCGGITPPQGPQVCQKRQCQHAACRECFFPRPS